MHWMTPHERRGVPITSNSTVNEVNKNRNPALIAICEETHWCADGFSSKISGNSERSSMPCHQRIWFPVQAQQVEFGRFCLTAIEIWSTISINISFASCWRWSSNNNIYIKTGNLVTYIVDTSLGDFQYPYISIYIYLYYCHKQSISGSYDYLDLYSRKFDNSSQTVSPWIISRCHRQIKPTLFSSIRLGSRIRCIRLMGHQSRHNEGLLRLSLAQQNLLA